jgi:hypothetical protein
MSSCWWSDFCCHSPVCAVSAHLRPTPTRCLFSCAATFFPLTPWHTFSSHHKRIWLEYHVLQTGLECPLTEHVHHFISTCFLSTRSCGKFALATRGTTYLLMHFFCKNAVIDHRYLRTHGIIHPSQFRCTTSPPKMTPPAVWQILCLCTILLRPQNLWFSSSRHKSSSSCSKSSHLPIYFYSKTPLCPPFHIEKQSTPLT